MNQERYDHLRFDLSAAFNEGADWFTAELFKIIAKADVHNRALLSQCFPDEVQVYEEFAYNWPVAVDAT